MILTISIHSGSSITIIVEDLRFWNINNGTTDIDSTVIACYITKDELSSLRSDHWITARELITIRSDPHNAGRVEKVFYWIDGAIENSCFSTTVTW